VQTCGSGETTSRSSCIAGHRAAASALSVPPTAKDTASAAAAHQQVFVYSEGGVHDVVLQVQSGGGPLNLIGRLLSFPLYAALLA
jgi:hypothetical protein